MKYFLTAHCWNLKAEWADTFICVLLEGNESFFFKASGLPFFYLQKLILDIVEDDQNKQQNKTLELMEPMISC